MSINLSGRNFLKLLDYTSEEIRYLLDLSKDLKAKKKAGVKGDSLVGKKGKVTVKTCPDNLKGKVAIGMEVWSADSEEEIEEGTEVEVVSTEGVHITVKKA